MGTHADGRPHPHADWRMQRAQLPLQLAAILQGITQLPEVCLLNKGDFGSACAGRACVCPGVRAAQAAAAAVICVVMQGLRCQAAPCWMPWHPEHLKQADACLRQSWRHCS